MADRIAAGRWSEWDKSARFCAMGTTIIPIRPSVSWSGTFSRARFVGEARKGKSLVTIRFLLLVAIPLLWLRVVRLLVGAWLERDEW